jgi:hypothetical protein
MGEELALRAVFGSTQTQQRRRGAAGADAPGPDLA